ncbi:MAG: metal-dependent phosphohydrolase, partial [Chloroflexota bacterium]
SLDFVPLKGEISHDLGGRDFTVDAMALTLDGQVVDPFGGREDLEARLIRALGEGAFEADPARLLRAVRLAGELGFEIDGRTQAWISSHAGELRRVAGERSRGELMRLLSLPRAREGVGLLDRLGLLLVLFPELGEGKGVGQPPEHYWDVYQHSLAAVGAVGFLLRQGNGWPEEALAEEPWGPFREGHFGGLLGGFPRSSHLKLTALLHDI